MKRHCGWLIALALAVAFAQAAGADDRSTAENNLRRALLGNILSLRTPTGSSKLEFNTAGEPAKDYPPAPWTTSGLLKVTEISLKHDALRMKLERVIVALRSTDHPDSPALVPIDTGRPVSLAVAVSSGRPLDATDLSRTLSQVFEPVDIPQRIATYWVQATPQEQPVGLATVFGTLEGGRPVYSVKSGAAEPPRVLYARDPEYTKSARDKRIQGTVTLMIVVNEGGFPEILEVIKGLDDGLDIQALAAVADWRFKPTTLNNQPMAVKINVEVTFKLF